MSLETQARCGAAEYGNVARANFAQIETRLTALETAADVTYLSTYGTLSAALSAIGSTTTKLIVDIDASISGNTTIPANIMLAFKIGKTISVATSATLTVDAQIDAGFFQIFKLTGTGKIYGSRQAATVKPHWWGISENDTAASAANSSALYEAVTSFVNCTIDLGGMIAYINQWLYVTDSAPWVTRRLHINGNKAQLICNANVASLAGPVVRIAGGELITAEGLSVETTAVPNIETDALVDSTYLLSIGGGISTGWAKKIVLRDIVLKNGWQCGAVVDRADTAIVEDFDIRNVIGSGVYLVNVRQLASVHGGYVYNTGDDSIAIVSDAVLPAGTLHASVDDVTCENSLASGVSFCGAQVCNVGNRVVVKNTYAPGIRTSAPSSGQQQRVVNIDGPTLIRCGRMTINGVPNNSSANSGIGIADVVGGRVSISATILDALYAGVIVYGDCARLDIENLFVDGDNDLAGSEVPTVFGVHIGGAAVSTIIDKAEVRHVAIKSTKSSSLYLRKMKDVTVKDSFFKDWNVLSDVPAPSAIAAVSSDRAQIDHRSNVFDGVGYHVDASYTTTYVGEELGGCPLEEGLRLHVVICPYVPGDPIPLTAREAAVLLIAANGTKADGTVLLPDKDNTAYLIVNNSGYTITPQITGGSGVALATGVAAWYIHTGVDYIRVGN